ncbi:peptidase inhibitor family I36 protein [Lentzea sp. NPDC003310]|uniref:peptidase inhibitor family I36 protein n=1 Tax=Lentzea sp. NPDC003310 TaxID=3154447 RepID=UPI00339F9710
MFDSSKFTRAGLAVAGAVLALAAGTTTASAAPQPGEVGAAATCGRGHFCAYSGINFTGTVIDMYKCRDHYIPWTSRGSWINNQTGGARAQFKDNNGIVRWTSDAPYTDDRDADWSWVHYVRPC